MASPWARAASTPMDSEVRTDSRDGECSACKSLTKSDVPMTSPASLAEDSAISSDFKIDRGVSIIHQMDKSSDAPMPVMMAST